MRPAPGRNHTLPGRGGAREYASAFPRSPARNPIVRTGLLRLPYYTWIRHQESSMRCTARSTTTMMGVMMCVEALVGITEASIT
jgi:hypothetical protein